MSFNMLNDDILLNILDLLSTNTESNNLALTCRYLQRLFWSYGHLKHLHFTPYSDNAKWEYLCNRQFALRELNMRDFNEPARYLKSIGFEEWPKKVIFEDCKIGRLINPTVRVRTEWLKISIPRNWNYPLSINWEKFPCLKILDIYGNKLMLNGIDRCKTLRAVRIISRRHDTVFPAGIEKLPELEFVGSNCRVLVPCTFNNPKVKFYLTRYYSSSSPRNCTSATNPLCFDLKKYL